MTDQSTENLAPLRESIYQLFLNGPTYDGDMISKSTRDRLVTQKLAERVEGYNFLTREGVKVALSVGFDREKEKRNRRRRQRDLIFDKIEALVKSARDSHLDLISVSVLASLLGE